MIILNYSSCCPIVQNNHIFNHLLAICVFRDVLTKIKTVLKKEQTCNLFIKIGFTSFYL